MKRYIFLVLFFVFKMNVWCQKQAPDSFTASFNEIIYAFSDNFESLKGKLDTSVKDIMIWKSKVKLPDAEDGYVVYDKTIFKDEKYTEFNERIFKSASLKQAKKKYEEFIEKIRFTNLGCCNLRIAPPKDSMPDSLKLDYKTNFYIESVKNDNYTKRFTFLKILVELKQSIDGEYEINMHIGDTNYY